MKKANVYNGFIRNIVIASLAIAGLGLLTYFYVPDYYTPAFPFLVIFFITSGLIIFHLMAGAVEKRPALFVNIFMLTTTLKLLVYMSVMLIYGLLNRDDAKPFIISFFILYVVYTIIEVIAMLKLNQSGGNQT